MLTTCPRMRFKNPHWYGFAEAPYTDVRPETDHLDIAHWVEQQTGNLWVAGSTPAIEQASRKGLTA
jgi:hypothetical protein